MQTSEEGVQQTELKASPGNPFKAPQQAPAPSIYPQQYHSASIDSGVQGGENKFESWGNFKSWMIRWRGSRRLVLVIVAIALLLDNMLLTVVGEGWRECNKFRSQFILSTQQMVDFSFRYEVSYLVDDDKRSFSPLSNLFIIAGVRLFLLPHCTWRERKMCFWEANNQRTILGLREKLLLIVADRLIGNVDEKFLASFEFLLSSDERRCPANWFEFLFNKSLLNFNKRCSHPLQ